MGQFGLLPFLLSGAGGGSPADPATTEAVAYVYTNVGASTIPSKEAVEYIYENVGVAGAHSREAVAYVYDNVLDVAVGLAGAATFEGTATGGVANYPGETALAGVGTTTAAAFLSVAAAGTMAGAATLGGDASLIPAVFIPGAASLAGVGSIFQAMASVDIDRYRELVLSDGPIGYWRLADSVAPINVSLRIAGGNQRLQTGDVSVTGDLEIIGRLALDNWATGNSVLYAKDANSSRDWQANIGAPGAGRLRWHWWNSAGTLMSMDYGTAFSSVMTNGTYYWIRIRFDVDDGAGNKVLTVSWAPDQATIPTSWTTLGVPAVSPGTTNIRDGTDPLTIGDQAWNVATASNHKYFELRNGFGGTAVARFDVNEVDVISNVTPASVMQGGNTWTLTGGALWSYGTIPAGQAADSSGNDLHGTYGGGPLRVAGALRNNGNKSTTFSGSGQYVDLGSPAELNPGHITVEAFFKTASTATQYIYRWRFNGIELYLQNGQLMGRVYTAGDAGWQVSVPGGTSWHDNKWHHVALTFDGINIRLYVDGAERGWTGLNPPSKTVFYATGSGNGAAIGRDGTNPNLYWNGSLDEVAVYDRALTADEIREHARRITFQSGWFWSTNMPFAVYHTAGAVVNDIYYSVGGWSGNYQPVCWAFDPTTQTWTVKANRPISAYNMAACGHKGKLYVSGGYWNAYRQDFHVYDPATNVWTAKALMPVAEQDHGIAGSDAQNKIYMFSSQSLYYIYDVATDSWSSAAMVNPSQSVRAVEHSNGKIYITGGQGGQLQRLQEFDPATNTFVSKANIPSGQGRGSHATMSLLGLIWIAGGWGNFYVNTAYSYDPTTNAWTQQESLIGGGRAYTAGGAAGGRLIVAGGYNNGTIMASTELYRAPATSIAAAMQIPFEFAPYPHGRADLPIELRLTGTPEEIGGTRVPKPGFIRIGRMTDPEIVTTYSEI